MLYHLYPHQRNVVLEMVINLNLNVLFIFQNGKRFFKVKRSFYSLEEETEDHLVYIESAPKQKKSKDVCVEDRIISHFENNVKDVSFANPVETATDASDQSSCDLSIQKVDKAQTSTIAKKRKLNINVDEINNNTEPYSKQPQSQPSEPDAGPIFLHDAIKRQKKMDFKPLFLSVDGESSKSSQPCKEFDFANTLSKARVCFI